MSIYERHIIFLEMEKKLFGLLALLLTYVLAIGTGIILFILLKDYVPFLLNALIVDVVATLIVWIFGIIFKTSSMYDPYWSVQTFVIYLGLLIYFKNFNLFTVIPLITIGIYSIRLTLNFLTSFHDLSYVDWRYKMLKERTGHMYQLINLLGICMFPTLVVFSASLPLFYFASLTSYSYLSLIGSGVILLGTLLELVSDIQMKYFIKHRKSRDEVINVGLWKYSRHPNYLGEILVWFGVMFVLLIPNIEHWYFIFGAFINLFMFLIISIPMEERHMLTYKPALKEYIKTTSMLLILPKKRNKVNKVD